MSCSQKNSQPIKNESDSAGTTLFIKQESHSAEGVDMPYRVLYPDHFDDQKKYPVLLFLHGGGERGNEKRTALAVRCHEALD